MDLYRTMRIADPEYDIPGLSPNAYYRLRLHFAETLSDVPGLRSSNAYVNGDFLTGTQVLRNFDVARAAGGPFRAVVKEFMVRASEQGRLNVHFYSAPTQAICSGVEVLPNPPNPQRKSVRIRCGHDRPEGQFEHEQFIMGDNDTSCFGRIGEPHSTAGVRRPAPDKVYQYVRYGSNFRYVVPGLDKDGEYQVRLHFAELDETAPEQRLFHVYVNNRQVLERFDVYREAKGPRTALIKEFEVRANPEGQLTIHFYRFMPNPPLLNGLELLPTSLPQRQSIKINCGGESAGGFGEDNYAVGGTIQRSDQFIDTRGDVHAAPQQVYQTQRIGDSFKYVVPGFRSGSRYKVRLHFAEFFWPIFLSSYTPQIDVTVNDRVVLRNFYSSKEAGYCKALVREFPTTADRDGIITITCRQSPGCKSRIGCNGIEVQPLEAKPNP